MTATVLLCVFFPVVTIVNSYCLGKMLGRYFKKYRVVESQSFAAGFVFYAFLILISVFLFVFIPIEYRILIYLLAAVHGLLLVLYCFSWRRIFAFHWPGWQRSLSFLAVVAVFYGISMLLQSLPAGSSQLPVISNQFVQTDSGALAFRFVTWQKFFNCWTLVTGGDYLVFVAYSAQFVLVLPCACVAYRFVCLAKGTLGKAAASLLIGAVFAAAVWRLGIADYEAWMIPAAMAIALEFKDYLTEASASTSSVFVASIAALAGLSMSHDFFYPALALLWGLVFVMAAMKDARVGLHFFTVFFASGLLISLFVYEVSIPAAGALFFATALLCLFHALLVSSGRLGHVDFMAGILVKRGKLILLFLFLLVTLVGLLLGLLAGFNPDSVASYAPEQVLGLALFGGQRVTYWAVVATFYALAFFLCLWQVFFQSTSKAQIMAFGALVLGNPLLVAAIAGASGSVGIGWAFLIPVGYLLVRFYVFTVRRDDWFGVLACFLVFAGVLGGAAYQVHDVLPLIWWDKGRLRGLAHGTPW